MKTEYNKDNFGLRNPNVSAEALPKNKDVGGYYDESTKTAHVPLSDSMLDRGLRGHEAGHSVFAPTLLHGNAIADQLIGDLRVHLNYPVTMPVSARRDEVMLIAHESRGYSQRRVEDSTTGAKRVRLALSLIRALCIVERHKSERGFTYIKRMNGKWSLIAPTYARTLRSLLTLAPDGTVQARNIIRLVKEHKFRQARKAAIEFLREIVDPKKPKGREPIGPGSEPGKQPGNQPGNEPGKQPGKTRSDETSPNPPNANGENESSDSEDGDGENVRDSLREALTEIKKEQTEAKRLAKTVGYQEKRRQEADQYTLKVLPLHNSRPRNREYDRGRNMLNSADSGSKLRVSKLYDAAMSPCFNDRLFRAKLKGGSILLDMSGSMGLQSTDVEQMLSRSPAAMIAGYAALRMTGDGRLAVLAERGYMVRDIPYLGGNNHVDGLALEWFYQCAPPFTYIGDLQFTAHVPEASTALRKLLARGCKVYYSLKNYYANKVATLRTCPACHNFLSNDTYCRYCHKYTNDMKT